MMLTRKEAAVLVTYLLQEPYSVDRFRKNEGRWRLPRRKKNARVIRYDSAKVEKRLSKLGLVKMGTAVPK